MTASKRAERALRRGFPTRTAERRHRMRQRFATAATADGQLTAAFDWFRSAAHHARDREHAMRSMAGLLAAGAEALERDCP